MTSRMLATLAMLALASLVAAGCKQAVGERCQVNADCASGICSQSDPHICVDPSNDAGGPIDVLPPPDGP